MATTDRVDNYPGFEEGIDGFELGERMQKGAERFGAETLYEEVTGVELEGDVKRITTTSGKIDGPGGGDRDGRARSGTRSARRKSVGRTRGRLLRDVRRRAV